MGPHPYIPNSVESTRRKLLEALGLKNTEELFSAIPDSLRLKDKMAIPEPFTSEYDLKRHVEKLLMKNKTCKENLNFLGSGCWQHYVPAVCDEINSRGEFLSAYDGETYSDLGKFQALFEYQSMMGELVGMDVVSAPSYDWTSAVSSSLLMASRLTGRRKVLVPRVINPDKPLHMKNFCSAALEIDVVGYDRETGLLDLKDLEEKISSETAAVYFECPNYFGAIEPQGAEISAIAHSQGALSIVGVDPTSLGLLAPPSDYGADIVCGEAQPLGIHMNCGGGLCGFIASPDEERYISEYPTMLNTIVPDGEGGWGFGRCTFDRTSYVQREASPDFTGTTQGLWGITAGVYLALLGPQGIRELGETIMERSHYAMDVLGNIEGVKVPVFNGVNFKEFLVNFDGTRKTVKDINSRLLEKGIFGGKDLSRDFPELGQTALFCVTEIHDKEDIDKLADAVRGTLL